MSKDQKLFKSMLRQFFLFSALQKSFLVEKRVTKIPPCANFLPPTRRTKFHYQCNSCKNYFSRKAIEVDHVTPLSSVSPSLPLIEWCIETVRICLDKKNLQILCKSCHTQKTNRMRREKGKLTK